jgi:ribose transport system ATP-binding protein
VSEGPALVARSVRKSFGATVALDGVDLEARAGEVHAVLGENGAGKSTLMAILGGAEAPDAGSVTLLGRPYAPRSPAQARDAGVAMVHQELSVCPHLPVAANVMLGREPTRRGFIDRRALRARAATALAAAASPERARSLPLDARVGDLSLADRQLVEIARALADEGCRVLILDEPTSSLGRDEVRVLFERIAAMRQRGICILYISHFLEEVREIADRFTVLRDGLTVKTGAVSDVQVADLVAAMAGTGASSRSPSSHAERTPGDVVLACEDLAGRARPVRASLELRCGEILGIAGLVGAGRTELLRVLFGLDPATSGSMRVLGRSGPASPARRIAQGVGMLSEDRKGEGLALGMSIADNLTLSKIGPVVRPTWQRGVAARWVERLGIRCRDVEQAVVDLSGGNQQKVSLGRLLNDDAQILLLDQPTRGVDVGAKAEIHALIEEMVARQKAVLLVSDDLSELRRLCDRIAVMHRGVLGPARPATEWTEESLLSAAAGATGPTS